LAQEFKERAKDHPVVNIYKKYGTPMLVSIMNTIGAFPTQYWSKGTLEGWEGISAEKPSGKLSGQFGRLSPLFHGLRKDL